MPPRPTSAACPRVMERHVQERKLTFVLLSAPRTKKNNSIIDTRGGKIRKLPSKAFEEWNKAAQMQLAGVRSAAPEGLLPFTVPVNVRALFFRHANIGDAVGFYQALADALQTGRVLENDVLVRQWDGSRLLVDRENPRIIVSIEAIA